MEVYWSLGAYTVIKWGLAIISVYIEARPRLIRHFLYAKVFGLSVFIFVGFVCLFVWGGGAQVVLSVCQFNFHTDSSISRMAC